MKPKLTADAQILYVDFDGPLHPAAVYRTAKRGIHLRGYPEHSLFQSAGVLVELLAPHPDVKIILSTSWVRAVGFSESKKRLPPELQQRVIGATWHSEMRQDEWDQLSRFSQIIGHVSRHRLTRWLAIDDDTHGWPDISYDRLVACNEHRGLSDPATQEDLRRKLEGL